LPWHCSQEKGKHDEEEAQTIFSQVVRALDYCHANRVAHRDLKPENIVFCMDPDSEFERVKITDFGLSHQAIDDDMVMNTFCGSMSYSSPEVLLQLPYIGPMADVWSLGVILYNVVCGVLPFSECTDPETLVKILDVKFAVPRHVSKPCADMLRRIIVREPKNRMTGKQILAHEWIAQSRAGGGGSASEPEPDLEPEPEVGSPVSKALHEQVVMILEQHAHITRTSIEIALETESYDYVASTYYLVAAQLQRRQRTVSSAKRRGTSVGVSEGAATTYGFGSPDGRMVAERRAQQISSSTGKKTGQLRRRVRPLSTMGVDGHCRADEGSSIYGRLASLALSPRLAPDSPSADSPGGFAVRRAPSDQSWDGLASTWSHSMVADSLTRIKEQHVPMSMEHSPDRDEYGSTTPLAGAGALDQLSRAQSSPVVLNWETDAASVTSLQPASADTTSHGFASPAVLGALLLEEAEDDEDDDDPATSHPQSFFRNHSPGTLGDSLGCGLGLMAVTEEEEEEEEAPPTGR
jgi:hypothetical protein